MTYTKEKTLEKRMQSIVLGLRLEEEKPVTKVTLHQLTTLRNELAKAQHEYCELTGHPYDGRGEGE